MPVWSQRARLSLSAGGRGGRIDETNKEDEEDDDLERDIGGRVVSVDAPGDCRGLSCVWKEWSLKCPCSSQWDLY